MATADIESACCHLGRKLASLGHPLIFAPFSARNQRFRPVFFTYGEKQKRSNEGIPLTSLRAVGPDFSPKCQKIQPDHPRRLSLKSLFQTTAPSQPALSVIRTRWTSEGLQAAAPLCSARTPLDGGWSAYRRDGAAVPRHSFPDPSFRGTAKSGSRQRLLFIALFPRGLSHTP